MTYQVYSLLFIFLVTGCSGVTRETQLRGDICESNECQQADSRGAMGLSRVTGGLVSAPAVKEAKVLLKAMEDECRACQKDSESKINKSKKGADNTMKEIRNEEESEEVDDKNLLESGEDDEGSSEERSDGRQALAKNTGTEEKELAAGVQNDINNDDEDLITDEKNFLNVDKNILSNEVGDDSANEGPTITEDDNEGAEELNRKNDDDDESERKKRHNGVVGLFECDEENDDSEDEEDTGEEGDCDEEESEEDEDCDDEDEYYESGSDDMHCINPSSGYRFGFLRYDPWMYLNCLRYK